MTFYHLHGLANFEFEVFWIFDKSHLLATEIYSLFVIESERGNRNIWPKKIGHQPTEREDEFSF